MVMNGGVGHAFDVLDESEIEAGIAGFRFYDLDNHANLLVALGPFRRVNKKH